MLTAKQRKAIEEELRQFPIAEYAFLDPKELPFSEKVRYICETDCGRYGRSWSCPPAVGMVPECRQRCHAYSDGFLFTTLHELSALESLQAPDAGRRDHGRVTRQVRRIFEGHGLETLALSAESCSLCKTCAYPEGRCRRPEEMLPCLEGYGILVTELAKRYGMDFLYGGNVVRWFSLILTKSTPMRKRSKNEGRLWEASDPIVLDRSGERPLP